MNKVSIARIVQDEHDIQINPTDLDHITYPEFVKYFADIEAITRHHLIIGANFTYGWMPTMLRFKANALDGSVAILNKAKRKELITESEVKTLSKLINNSVVGTSKLLHFIAPSVYAIWDSRVYWYINGRESWHHMNKPQNYFAYLSNCEELVRYPNFALVYSSMTRKLGYSVSPLRIVELIMYMKGGK